MRPAQSVVENAMVMVPGAISAQNHDFGAEFIPGPDLGPTSSLEDENQCVRHRIRRGMRWWWSRGAVRPKIGPRSAISDVILFKKRADSWIPGPLCA